MVQLINSEKTLTHKNGENCTVVEYPFENEKDINMAAITLTGRYPDEGTVVNTVCKELMYIQSGEGIFTSDGQEKELHPGDTLLIQPDEMYFLEGNLTLIACNSPAWYPEQHKNNKS